jgi:hypothetical protein
MAEYIAEQDILSVVRTILIVNPVLAANRERTRAWRPDSRAALVRELLPAHEWPEPLTSD